MSIVVLEAGIRVAIVRSPLACSAEKTTSMRPASILPNMRRGLIRNLSDAASSGFHGSRSICPDFVQCFI